MSTISDSTEIGGYFPLERGVGKGLHWLPRTNGYRSARAAIAATLLHVKPRAVWVPNYICGAVNDALDWCGVAVRRYALTQGFGVPDNVQLEPLEWLICVDYFGINANAVVAAQDRFGAERILVDASQSLFHRPHPNGTAVYSVRKFVGVPDGGLLASNVDVELPSAPDEQESVARCAHLLTRLSGAAETGYAQFQAAEESLHSCEPVAMSRLCSQLIGSIDFDRVARTRIDNYQTMETELSLHGMNMLALPKGAVPLCCPVFDVDAVALRQALAASKIFTPCYWPDAAIPQSDGVARCLRDRTLYLPCDQRYDRSQIGRVVRTLLELKELS